MWITWAGAEAKPKVVPRKDKAHLISLVGEVVDISKLLEKEKTLEASEQRPSRWQCRQLNQRRCVLCSRDLEIRCYTNQ